MSAGETHNPGDEIPAHEPCSTCREPIRINAVRCVHCDAYQGWRRHISLSSTVLALLVALVSVTSAAVGSLTQALTPVRSDVQVKYLFADDFGVWLSATNSGSRAGIIAGGSIEFPPENHLINLPGIPYDPILLTPGETKVFRVSIKRPIESKLKLALDDLLRRNPQRQAALSGWPIEGTVLATVRVYVRQFDNSVQAVKFPITVECDSVRCTLGDAIVPEAMIYRGPIQSYVSPKR